MVRCGREQLADHGEVLWEVLWLILFHDPRDGHQALKSPTTSGIKLGVAHSCCADGSGLVLQGLG